jgi:hypothetical protein
LESKPGLIETPTVGYKPAVCESIRAGIISCLSRRDELHVSAKIATLGEMLPSGRLASRRAESQITRQNVCLQLDASWELPLRSYLHTDVTVKY